VRHTSVITRHACRTRDANLLSRVALRASARARYVRAISCCGIDVDSASIIYARYLDNFASRFSDINSNPDSPERVARISGSFVDNKLQSGLAAI